MWWMEDPKTYKRVVQARKIQREAEQVRYTQEALDYLRAMQQEEARKRNEEWKKEETRQRISNWRRGELEERIKQARQNALNNPTARQPYDYDDLDFEVDNEWSAKQTAVRRKR